MIKRTVAIILLLAMALSVSACSVRDGREVSCEEIIAAYREAGYVLCYHNHDDPVYYELNEACHMELEDPGDPEKNYIYITRYFTEEDAEEMEKERRFNVILWLFFGVFGEWRWLKSGVYGDVYYESFDYKIISPLKELMND